MQQIQTKFRISGVGYIKGIYAEMLVECLQLIQFQTVLLPSHYAVSVSLTASLPPSVPGPALNLLALPSSIAPSDSMPGLSSLRFMPAAVLFPLVDLTCRSTLADWKNIGGPRRITDAGLAGADWELTSPVVGIAVPRFITGAEAAE